ncbi:MAG: hypothetical protein ACRD0K_22830 [Egibacteraceae bacterium]
MSEHTVLGSGPVAFAYALFAARNGPVILRCRPPATVPAVESVPAPLLTLLLELGITPAELDVDRLSTHRLVAWDDPVPAERQSPSCAHLNRAALTGALWRRVQDCPDIQVLAGGVVAGGGAARLVDATGRRAVTASGHTRPSPVWVATCCTVARDDLDPSMRLAAGPAGYGYRLGSARWLTVGWVGPGTPPRHAAELSRRLEASGAGWLADGVSLHQGHWSRRVASLDIPHASREPDVVAIGDAALARDALASQGMSIGLSDARLAAGRATRQELEHRRADGLSRHLRSLDGVLAACHHRDLPAWSAYERWVGHQLEVATRPAREA